MADNIHETHPTPASEPVPPSGLKGNGADEMSDNNVTPQQPAAKSPITAEEQAVLDEAEELANDALLDEDDGDDPGAKDEVSQSLVVKKLPAFVSFMASPTTFELFGTVLALGMDELLYCTTKSFAPNFEEDVELRRFRFYETVTPDGVVRLVWCPLPGKDEKKPNSWITSKIDALEHAKTMWTTMRSRKKLQQWTYRPSRKQKEHGKPKFSGRTPAQWILELKKQGMLVVSKDHEFYKKATDSE
jgi:hypothetical protein